MVVFQMVHSFAWLALVLVPIDAFSSYGASRISFAREVTTHQRRRFEVYSTKEKSPTSLDATTLELNLEKPLGMILEEIEEGAPKGVFVKELSEGGSAFSSPYRDEIVGRKVLSVSGCDMSTLTFDQAMEKIIEAPSPLLIELELENSTETVEGSDVEGAPTYDIGTAVTVTVMQEGKPTISIESRVGDNLRKTLLDNNVELYRGLKKKLGNCGGGGQCTFCAVNFLEEEGWGARSEYEDTKVGKQGPNVRLACLNNIQGPCTVQVP